MAYQTHTLKMRGYTTKAGYAQVEGVLERLRVLYNAGLEERRWERRSKEVPARAADDCEFCGAYILPGRPHCLKGERKYDGKPAKSGAYVRRLPKLPNGQKHEWRGRAHQTLQLKHIRADNPDYAAIDNQLLNATLTRLDTAMQAVFGRIKRGEKPGFPRFKGVGRFRTIEARTVCPAWLDYVDSKTAYITIKGLPPIKVWHKGRLPAPVKGEGALTRGRLNKETGEIIGGGNPKPTNVRGTWPLAIKITLKGRRLWVSLAYEVDKPELPPEPAGVGIDRGVNRRAAFSGGYQEPDTPSTRGRADRRKTADAARVKKHRRRQAKLRRQAVKQGRAEYKPQRNGRARVVWVGGKPSREYRKSGAIARNILDRQQTAEGQATHRLTTDIIRRHGRVALEKLNIKGMTASAAGTVDEPGVSVSAKRGLNREILARNWGELARQLAYKAAWAGREYGEVNPAFTSQICHKCGIRGRRRGTLFECLNPVCGWVGDADDNGAENTLARYDADKSGAAWPSPVIDALYRGETAGESPSPCAAGIVVRPEPKADAGGPRHAQESAPRNGLPTQLPLAL